MITEEEKLEIVDMAVEKALRLLPETLTNLMISKEIYDKMTEKFYSENKEFQEYKPIVAEVVSKIEGQDPTKSYEQILKEATPKIKEAIELRKQVSMDKLERKDLNLNFDETPKLKVDEDYGEI